MIKVALTEDNPYLAKSLFEKLAFFSDVSIKFHAENGVDLLEKIEKNTAIDLVLMDIQMPEMDGIEATLKMKERYPQIKILMLTVFDDEENIFNAVLAGADGYLLKDEPAKSLYKAILEIQGDGAPMSPLVAKKALKLLRNPLSQAEKKPENFQLSDREMEVLQQISKGLNYIQISQNLFLSTGTVRKHTENIYKKLRVHNKVEALEKARKNRIVD